jgi:hypothetical protein
MTRREVPQRKILSLTMIAAIATVIHAHAQQAGAPSAQAPATTSAVVPTPTAAASATASSAPATAPAAAASAPAAPSADLIKKARAAGFKPETQKDGTTMFCYKDADTGTRFQTKKCVDQDHLNAVLNLRQNERENLNRPSSCAGVKCGN